MTNVTDAIPTSLYRAAQVQELDRVAIEDKGIAGITLMERAGKAAFDILAGNWPQAKTIAVVCGAGNNGGDGYVVARLAHETGYKVRLLPKRPPEKLSGTAREAADKLLAAGVEPLECTPDNLAGADIIVDALLGTGLDSEVKADWRPLIEAINANASPVLAIDIPSGLHADTGQVMGVAVKAAVTPSFIGLKQGLFTGSGPEYSGRVMFDDLGVPEEIYSSQTPASQRINYSLLKYLLPRRGRSAHKGHYGHVLIVGGSPGFSGAAVMAGSAAGRVGAGLVSLATHPSRADVIGTGRPELMVHAVETAGELKPLVEKATVIAIGPGLGQSEWAMNLLSLVLETTLPLVLDADALNLLAKEPVQNDRWVLTPHPGEAARLLETDTAAVQSDRFAAVREIQQRYGGTVVLKGSGSLISDRYGNTWICDGGNPGMASGGMGDVLTGVVAGFLAQGYLAADAARLGICVHAEAGDRAALAGERGLLAMDLVQELRRLVNPDPE